MDTTYEILITAPYFLPVVDRFGPRLEEAGCRLRIEEVEERATQEQLKEWLPGVHGTICGDDPYTEEVLEVADSLQVISKWGTGIDSIDTEACRERDIAVRNTPGAFSRPVADSVLSYALSFARRTPWLDRDLKRGGWRKIPGHSLSEWTLGIIGVGDIGSEVARRAAPFGCRILGSDIVSIPATLKEETGLEQVELEELLGAADVVSLNCDLNPTSRYLIRSETLGLMKPDAYLINTARGPVVKEADLIAALREGHLAGAALDVFEEEPLPRDSTLRSMDNVLLAPHNANSSPEAWERVHENTVKNLLQGLGVAHE
ncbi:MAG: phosphoglycerate dehydrogenase [bacterium]